MTGEVLADEAPNDFGAFLDGVVAEEVRNTPDGIVQPTETWLAANPREQMRYRRLQELREMPVEEALSIGEPVESIFTEADARYCRDFLDYINTTPNKRLFREAYVRVPRETAGREVPVDSRRIAVRGLRLTSPTRTMDLSRLDKPDRGYQGSDELVAAVVSGVDEDYRRNFWDLMDGGRRATELEDRHITGIPLPAYDDRSRFPLLPVAYKGVRYFLGSDGQVYIYTDSKDSGGPIVTAPIPRAPIGLDTPGITTYTKHTVMRKETIYGTNRTGDTTIDVPEEVESRHQQPTMRECINEIVRNSRQRV